MIEAFVFDNALNCSQFPVPSYGVDGSIHEAKSPLTGANRPGEPRSHDDGA
jgi:hypothetical protein